MKNRKWLRVLLSAFVAAILIELYAVKTGRRLTSEISTLVMLGLTIPVYFTIQIFINLKEKSNKES